MSEQAAISQRIWDMKYRLKAPDGTPVDATVEDSWRRVATALAEAEQPEQRAAWAERFRDAMADYRFLPAGRILAGAGTGRTVTLFNCFVMGAVPDDMSGIFTHLREAALTLQQGGGIGYDFSTLRPKGAPVHGVGADASGPLSFMDVWDAMCRTIMSAGARRGAMMATLRCDHPDIEGFIAAKREPGRLRNFNLSVLCTDAFMQAVADEAPWPLVFGGRTFRTVPAAELWDAIMRATYDYAEPGVIFIDRINRRNNLHYCEQINATNPCVTADTWVQTGDGPRQVADLIGRPFVARVDGAAFASGPEGFFATGTKPILELRTRAGHRLRLTSDHLVRTAARVSRGTIGLEWTAAGQLRPGDRILLHDHRTAAEWPGRYDAAEGYLMGLLVGDGTLKSDKIVLSVWRARRVANGDDEPMDGTDGVMAEALEATRGLAKRADFKGWWPVSGRTEWRMSLGALRPIAIDLGLIPGKHIGRRLEGGTSSGFYRGFLRGLFDADGTVLVNRMKGVSVRLAQSDPGRLEAVQRMLLRLGIVSKIYSRRPEGTSLLPDGMGGSRPYATKAQFELVIANENLARFAELVGFADGLKAQRLARCLAGYRRQLNRERFLAEIETVVPAGEAPVFDVSVPGIHAFDANGIHVHNCGEQPLPPYGACLLGSINLAALVEDPFGPEARLDEAALDGLTATAIRMLDNAIDLSRFPLEAQAEEARAKRRIGLGVTGLADALIQCRLRYGSAEATEQAAGWMARIQRAAYLASVELAREKGSFPLFDREAYLRGESVAELDADIRSAIAQHGIRNALLTSIAPTGTISLLAGNVSSGIEPVFSFTHRRTVLMPDGSRRQEEVSDYAYRLYRERFGEETALPDYFVDAQTLEPAAHVAMQAAIQRHVDSSISKTINCPADLAFEAFKDVYRQAYESGCKGCTTYRPNAVTGAVLEASSPLAAAATALPPAATSSAELVYMTQPLSRPEALPGETYKVRWPDSDHAIYITINDIVQDGRRRPFEVFINSKNMDHYAWTVALTRMVSAVFRRGGDVAFVVEELKAVFDPRGGAWMEGRYVPSLLAAIGNVIERHMIDIGALPGPASGILGEEVPPQVVNLSPTALRSCPRCGQPSLVRQEGCDTCSSCGFSKCS